ncbi:hypothetical protein AT727_05790 [Desulfitobacterium hafniense]|uniref:Hydrogenase maturation factor HypA n=2 Tax=Desulfitobacterium hafniense TaxID=49338 RepID=A0A0W1JI89_DESHA|nr:hypothetical protein AT727_05790 [Desulfitobacterium hafniense]
MHELAITRSVLSIVLKHAEEAKASKVLVVRLKIGELRDIVNHLMQSCFTYLARGTIAADTFLAIDRVPLTAKCRVCHEIFPFNIQLEPEETVCPQCGGRKLDLVTGQEFYIEDIEVV